ncbi:DeoR/GlpR family DNA-binding transcription regulator [Geomicrobium sp. JCM 19038]|uniref:DeoR/GlpR family DNA-binding transcription regulator n=1 Tax=Geomicrobium sp. JCM 19038 TaxID=1460635 RepID=UPI0005A83CAD|nr:DeoR/GlpR family DNA-binding transcription regulator [Geomicrobium sp. JCM 19038]
MSFNQRQREILDLLSERGELSIHHLEEIFQVSSMTIRRDLGFLAEQHKIIRTHGGAMRYPALIHETEYSSKSMSQVIQKQKIADEALKKIKSQMTILLDSGTTTLQLAKRIKERDDLTIITNDVSIMYELIDCPSTVISTGGTIQKDVGSLLGPHAAQLLKNVNVDLCFTGIHAIHTEAGLTVPTLEKAQIKRMMIEAATEAWVLCDSTKLMKTSLAKVCNIDEIAGIITDEEG